MDNAYALIRPDQVDPADARHFILADGSGGFYHYTGHVVSGPYKGSGDLCPVMLSLGIEYLSAYPYTDAVGFSAADCQTLLAPPAVALPTTDLPLASAAATAGAGAIVTSGGDTGPDGGTSPASPSFAVLLVTALIGSGGLALLARALGWGPFASGRPAPVAPGAPRHPEAGAAPPSRPVPAGPSQPLPAEPCQPSIIPPIPTTGPEG